MKMWNFSGSSHFPLTRSYGRNFLRPAGGRVVNDCRQRQEIWNVEVSRQPAVLPEAGVGQQLGHTRWDDVAWSVQAKTACERSHMLRHLHPSKWTSFPSDQRAAALVLMSAGADVKWQNRKRNGRKAKRVKGGDVNSILRG